MKKITLGLLLSLVLFLTACDAMTFPDPFINRSSTSQTSEIFRADMAAEEAFSTNQQVAYSGSATAETKTFNNDQDKLLQLVKDHQGIVRAQDAYRYYNEDEQEDFTQIDFSLDIPQAKADAFVAALKEAFIFSRFSFSGVDMTENLNTTQAQLDKIEEEIDRVQQLIDDSATSNADKITLEGDLRSLNEQKAKLEEQIETGQNQVNYSHFQLSLREVPRYYNEEPGAMYFVGQAFRGFFQYAISLLAMSLMSLFFVIPYIIVGILTYLITRKLTQRFIHGIGKDGGRVAGKVTVFPAPSSEKAVQGASVAPATSTTLVTPSDLTTSKGSDTPNNANAVE